MTTAERILSTFTSKVDVEKEYTRGGVGKDGNKGIQGDSGW